MQHLLRSTFPYAAVLGALGALAWAVSFGTLPLANFTFNNEDEVKTVDPSKATGNPEHRILMALYDGLLRLMPVNRPPDKNGIVPLEVVPGTAELPEISADGKTYSFRIRKNARWTNGDPVTAHDFVWSWRRTLHPDTASEYAFQLHYLVGGKRYQTADIAIGDQVEVELADRADANQPFPRGTLVRGLLKAIAKPPAPEIKPGTDDDTKSRVLAEWKAEWVYILEEKARGRDGQFATDWNVAGKLRAFSPQPPKGTWQRDADGVSYSGSVAKCQNVLIDFETQVGVKAVDDFTLVVTLHNPTSFFAELTTFYPLFPMNRTCVEQHGSPAWTKPQNIVTNGPFTLQSRRIRDRIRLAKNPNYWDAANIKLEVIDALPLKSRLTGLNMFLNGELDWNHAPASNMIPYLKNRPDYLSGPALIIYFYRLNIERKGLNDKRVRQALNLAMDKKALCEQVKQAGEIPSRSLVPIGLAGYTPALCGAYNPTRAKQLLAEAGYPNGRGFPKLEILFNSDEVHRSMAEVIQQQWKRNLGVSIELKGIAWPAYLEQMHKIDFDICRAGWIPDYSDPNTYLDMFITGGLQNSTHWGSKEYDALIAAAAAETDFAKRMQHLHDAEVILMDEMPIIPVYQYVSTNQVKARVRGFFPNVQDINPLYALSVDDSAPRGR